MEPQVPSGRSETREGPREGANNELGTANFQAAASGSVQKRESVVKGEHFESRVRDELPVLYRVARRLGASPEHAEDLVQQTLYKAYRKWHQFDGRYLRSWLVRILRNERLAEIRSGKDDKDHDELKEDTAVDDPFWPALETQLEADRILQALHSLSEAHRMVVQLCDVEQMSYEETAEAMDIPIGTVRSRLFRARAEIRRRLGGAE